MEIESLIIGRMGRSADIPFITNSWLNSYWDNGDWPKMMEKTVFMEGEHRMIHKFLKLSSSKVFVCCKYDDDDQILGYIVYSPHVLHWLYVKSPFRQQRIARWLLGQVFSQSSMTQLEFYTHRTKFIDWLKLSSTYNPYLFYNLL